MIPPAALEPVELPDSVIEQLLGDLRVPDDRRAAAGPLLRALIRIAHNDHAIDTADKKRKADLKAVCKELESLTKTARLLRAKLDRLTDQARVRLRLELLARRVGAGGAGPLFEVFLGEAGRKNYERLCLAMDHILGAASAASSRPKRPANAPSKQLGSPGSTAFDHFVLLLYAGKSDGLWSVTINPGDGEGTLSDFLKRAQPYLPQGFVPHNLWVRPRKGSISGWKRLQLIGTNLGKAAPAKEGWFRERVRAMDPLARHPAAK